LKGPPENNAMEIKNKKEALVPGSIYHIYNRANGSEKLFLSYNNYIHFLEKYFLYISPIADTFCYCLMPNHFHFLVRIKSEEVISSFFERKRITISDELKSEHVLSQQFSNFFNGYAKHFNEQNSRKGSLFMHTFKRIKVEEQNYLLKLIHYIHNNPVEAKLCSYPSEWNHSSFKRLISPDENVLKRNEVIGWFDSVEDFQSKMNTSSLFLQSDLQG
jgi:REP element-mobilizing transposase RayT